MNTSNLGNPSTLANPLAVNNLFVPCVPISVSANLVASEPLVKKLAAVVSSSTPELANLSITDFARIQLKKSELRIKVDECAAVEVALLDACLLNIEDLFSDLAAYQTMLGQGVQEDVDEALKRIHAYSAAIGLAADKYCVESAIHPDMLFDACLERVQALQKRWQDNYSQSVELALQLQRDVVYGAAASCLMKICQDGLDNQISIEPTPQAQEDVLVAMATFVDAPFSGEWPVLRQRVIVSGHEGGAQ
jgi:hypothetical protein